MKQLILGWMLVVGLGGSAWAHDGDHDVPGNVQAPKGGLIRTTEDGHFELLAKGKSLKLYFYSSDGMKPVPTDGIQIDSTVSLPRKSPVSLAWADKKTHWESEFDPKNAHRYTIDLKVKVKQSHRLKFVVEPKK